MATVEQNQFWESDDKIAISQKSVAIPATNGLTYSGGQRVIIEVPPNIQFFQPKQSFLEFDIKLSIPSGVEFPTLLQLDETLGGNSIIKEFRIYSGGVGKILLEEYSNYNCLTNVKYSYETNDVIRAKRALTEGSTYHSVKNRGTAGTTESHKNNTTDNPYFNNPSFKTGTDKFNDDDFKVVKCILPLHTGIFASNKVFPNMLTDGLVIDIILEDGAKVVKQLDTASRFRTLQNLPVFHSINGDEDAPDDWDADAKKTEFYIRNTNSMTSEDKLPFCVGEVLGFVKNDGTLSFDNASKVVIESWETNASGLIKINLSGTDASVNTDVEADGNWFVYSRSCDFDTWSGVNYTVSNVELKLQQLDMPQGYISKMMSMMKEGGQMNYDFLSFTNYKYSQLYSDVVANIRLPLNMARAKAILSVPTDATSYKANEFISGSGGYISYDVQATRDFWYHSDKAGMVGCVDFLKEYQYFYDGKLNPSRKIDVSRTSSQVSISQSHLIELEKALVMSNINPYSFREFNKNFVIGRALSLHNGCYDTRGKDFNLQVEYSGTGKDKPDKNKLWMNFVAHLRRIVFNQNGISLQV